MFKSKFSISFFIFFLTLNSVFAEIIKDFKVEGNERITDETIILFSDLKLNQSINDSDLNKALKKLYQTNFFEDISISLKNGILNIKITENPIIENISYSGIKSNNLKEKILKDLELRPRVSFNLSSLKNDKIKILTALKKSGYYFSEISASIEELSDNKVNINYIINLKDKSKIKKITFLGNKIFKDGKLKSIIVSEETKFWKFISSKKYLNEDLIQLDTRLLKNFYLDKGYYNVEIKSTFAKILDNNSFELIYSIDPKQKIFFNDIKIIIPTSFDEAHFLNLKNIFEDLKGKHYSINSIKKIINEIDKITLNEEYVSVTANLTENIIDNKINIDFTIDEKEIEYVKKINIFGNNVTREDVFRNQLEIDEGDPFNEILYNKSINNIRSLNFFKNVTSEVISVDNSDKVINISVEEKPTGEIMAGAGFGTSGGTITFGIKENNYLGRGISLNTNLTVNESTIKGILSINNPNISNSDNSGYLTIQALETDKLSDFGYKSNKAGFTFGTGFEYFDDLNLSLGTSTFYEKIETDATASERQKKQQGDYLDTFIKLDFDYDKRNQRFQASEGYRSIYSVDLPIISKTNTLNNSYSIEYFTEFYENNISSFAFTIENVLSLTGDDIKLSERLYAPSRKLRGFEQGKIGPKDGNDYVGGNFFTSFNINSTLPQILPNSQYTDFLVFFDAANLWGVDYDSSIDKNNKIRTSIGFGLDWFTPVGPLSLSISQPITKSSTDITETFRFNLGTTF